MNRKRQSRSLQSRLPARFRKRLTQMFLALRARQKLRRETLQEPAFLTWPPVSDPCDARDLVTRLQWFFPRRFTEPVRIATAAQFRVPPNFWTEGTEVLDLPNVEKTPVEFVSEPRLLEALRRAGPHVLIHSVLRLSNANVAGRLDRCFVIDPDWYSAVEEAEWTLLYEQCKAPDEERLLGEISRTNLRGLRERAARATSINVCGSGPSIQRLVQAPPPLSLNIVSNTAVQSSELTAALQPAVIAFANGVFFGPSEFARKVLCSAERCVHEYGSVIVVPGGFAHHLIVSNYPALAEHTMGIRLGNELNVPVEDRLATKGSSNVATALMVPIAAALGPKRIDIWGCDGGPAEQRSRWSPWRYFAGGEPARDSATWAHPAFFRDRVITERKHQKYMAHHHEFFSELLEYLENKGFTIRNRTPSAIPALQQRLVESPQAV